MSDKIYDIVIIGLGPAGSTLARLLDSSSLRVACIDLRTDSGGFDKPCGGLLAPDAQAELARWDLTLPSSVLASPQIFSVRTLDLDSGQERRYQRFYINIDRNRFDRWLISLIPPAVDILGGSRCTAILREGELWRVNFVQDGVARSIVTRQLVGADGAHSLVRRRLYPNCKMRSYTSIQQWFPETHANPFYSCVFDSANTDCYSWSLSKDDRFLFGGAYPSKYCRARFERQKKSLERHGFRFGEPLSTEACLVLRPSSPADLCCGYDNAFLIGEAGGFISPSSLEGISSAMRTATLLANTLASGKPNPNRRYFMATLSLRGKIFIKLCKCPFMYWPWLRHLVMMSGLQSIKGTRK